MTAARAMVQCVRFVCTVHRGSWFCGWVSAAFILRVLLALNVPILLAAPQPPMINLGRRMLQLSCVDDPAWDGGYGGCSTYAAGGENHGFCDVDGATSVCLPQCTGCVPGAPWQVANDTHGECNDWQLTAHEDGWGGATMLIHASGVLQIENFTYANDQFVSAGVASACLHPSRCYTITVDGPPTAHWSIRDAFDVVVVEGSAPFAREVCHCGHYGGDACSDCTDILAPTGGTFGSCRADGILSHGHRCLLACAQEGRSRPLSCFNGTLRTPVECCAAGTEWIGESDTVCDECTLGRMDSDGDPSTPCEHCPPGTYSDTVGATECIACPPGAFAVAGSSDCTACAPGTHDGDSDASTACIECPAGTYSGRAGATECARCEPGSSAIAGASECTECEAFMETVRSYLIHHAPESLALMMNNNGALVAALGLNDFESQSREVVDEVSVPARFVCNKWVGQQGEGALYVTPSARVAAENSAFVGNQAFNAGGGAIYAAMDARVDIGNSAFAGNQADEGGAIYAAQGAQLTVENSAFVDNTAHGQGGAIWAGLGALMIIEHSAFVDNAAHSAGSGGIYIAQSAQVAIENSAFTGNRAFALGGAIHVDQSAHVAIKDSVFVGNKAFNDGGGAIYVAMAGQVSIENSAFLESQAYGNDGGAIYVATAAHFTIKSSVLVDNHAHGDGAHICAYAPNLFRVHNTSFNPFERGVKSVSLNVLAGCEENPCTNGFACSYLNYSTFCIACPEPLVGADGVRCEQCAPGKGPNENRTACEDCAGQTYSPAGTCLDCPAPNVVNGGRTECLSCRPGQEPNENHTACLPCVGATYSQFGVRCFPCEAPSVVSTAHLGDRIGCALCPAGQGPNSDRMACVDCVGTTYSISGTCEPCAGIVDAHHRSCSVNRGYNQGQNQYNSQDSDSDRTECSEATTINLALVFVLVLMAACNLRMLNDKASDTGSIQDKQQAAKSAPKVDTKAQKKKQVSRPPPPPHCDDHISSPPPPPPPADPELESLEQLELDEPDVVKTNPMLYGAEDDEKPAAACPAGDGSAGDDFEIEATTRTTLGEENPLTKKKRKAAEKATKKAEKQALKAEKKKTKSKSKGKAMETEYHSQNHAGDVTDENSLADAALE